ncbi:MAG: hypothetical protein IKS24_00950 [Bacteroidaceae bacterium]|nr:hypothetical protein [Bacteroidaceae bacterium]
MLARYYASHPIVDSDEELVASLIRIAHSEADPYAALDSSEFDSIVSTFLFFHCFERRILRKLPSYYRKGKIV